jgi:hypothetical protein
MRLQLITTCFQYYAMEFHGDVRDDWIMVSEPNIYNYRIGNMQELANKVPKSLFPTRKRQKTIAMARQAVGMTYIMLYTSSKGCY